MLWNYIKVALRNLNKRRGFTFINILGLAIGVACCLLIAIYVYHEISYDRFHDKSDRIYRVTQKTVTPTDQENGASTPFPVAPALKNDFPGLIDKTVRFFDMQEDVRTIVKSETDEAFRVHHFYVVDSTFFDVFTATLVRGNPENVLDEPMSAVITEEQAHRFFGDENPIGKLLNFKGSADFTVTGVMKSLPSTSHMKIDMLVSFSSLVKLYHTDAFLKSWYWNPCWTYVLLKEGVSAQKLQQQLPAFVKKNYTGRADGEEISLGLQHITDIHLYSHLDQEMEPNNSIFNIYLFSAVAVLILLIACINFMNLSTARSTERAREVGMRKVLGAERSHLFGQFIGESFLMTFLGFVVAVFIVYLSLPLFSDFVGKQLSFNFLGSWTKSMSFLGLFVLVVFCSGLYPALYLSGFNPTAIMQGTTSIKGGGELFRKGLVIFQFVLSVILITGTVIVYLQLHYMQDKEMGFDKERIVAMPITQTLIAWDFQKFKKQALASSSILNVTGVSKILGSEKQFYSKYAAANMADAPPTNMFLDVTYDFLDTYNIDLLAGRSFSPDHPADPDHSIIINRSMLKQINIQNPRDALGKTFYYTKSNGDRKPFQVIGVVADFNYTSIKKPVDPLVIHLVQGEKPIVRNINYAVVRLAPNGIQAGLADLKKVWKRVNHIDPFTYFFQDQQLQKTYKSEARMSQIAGLFAILCVFVACLGLFGLASFTSSLRTKEIGIRKTLGATVPGIVGLLSKEYLKLVLLSNLIAWPGIYFLAADWLEGFPYRIALGWNLVAVYMGVAILSLAICLLTVSYQSIRAALVNPVDSIQQQ
ncbi:MAG: ABC transporter permease [Balneolaceae bacterium]|jgi:putative ABC transport system permease protein